MSECRIMDYNYVFQSNVTLTPSTEDTFFPASNLANFGRTKVWRTTSVTSQSLVIDLKTTESIDTFIMLFHPLDGSSLSEGATVTLQGNATDEWSSPAYSGTPTLDEDFEIYSLFLSAAQTYRYWRLVITDPSNDLGYIEVGKIILTKATQLSQCPEIGFSYKNDDLSKQSRNDFNQVYVDVKPNVRTFEFNYAVLSMDDFETLQTIYDRVGSSVPICMSLDTQESLFDKDRFIIYGHMDGTLNSKHHVLTYFDQPLTIKEAF